MQPLSAPPKPRRRDTARRDPAPSRLSYRFQRLLLTPMIWRIMRVGLPVACLAVSSGLYLSDAARRGAIVAAVEDVKAAVRQRPEFMVRLMAIDGAAPPLAEAIRALFPIDFPVSSFDLDLLRMRTAVAALPAVARVDMRVRPGGVLQVAIAERMPVAILRNDSALDLVDAAGIRVAPLAARSERHDLPLIAGPGAEARVDEALALFAAAAPLSDDLRGLVRIGQRRWDMILDDGQTIRLPATAPVPALERVVALHLAKELFERDVVSVDMRLPRRPVLRLGAEATDELRHIRATELGDD